MSEEALALSPLLLFPSLTCSLVRPPESLARERERRRGEGRKDGTETEREEEERHSVCVLSLLMSGGEMRAGCTRQSQSVTEEALS